MPDLKPKSEEVDDLVQELFCKVQGAQGYAYVSDGENFATKAEFFERIRGRLEWSKKATRIMRDFLNKYGELNR